MKKILIASLISCSFSSFASINLYDGLAEVTTSALSGTEKNTSAYCGIEVVKQGDGQSAIYTSEDNQSLSSIDSTPEFIVYNNDPSKSTSVNIQAALSGEAVVNIDKNKVYGEVFKISDGIVQIANGLDSGANILQVDQSESNRERYKVGLNLNSVRFTLDKGDIAAQITLTISCD